ncbi:MAG: UDP-N-acetylglucosamine 2-epimerase (non-hydrolyzing) [Anaerolineae bacterium]|nr:UDP-N-acetylglucosamine 2-epimerase (non-hydrolyzing) [Anaerolineae bacterium]
MKIVSVVGARPQFIKAAPVSRVLRRTHTEMLVHTGQHYDDNMSAVFFAELDLPQPDINLNVGSASHGAQTAAMLAGIEQVLLTEKPDWVLVYGDTNSTLAGALAAAKLHIPVAHVEAGLRSFNRAMPEEINRVLTDHIADLLFCPSQTAVDNLAAEGITVGVHLVGDVMADALAYAAERAPTHSDILQRLGLAEKGFLLATVHRAENTDDPARLRAILDAFAALDELIVFPVHPRTRDRIAKLESQLATPNSQFANLKSIDPVGYLDMVRLMQAARMILTDSGGIQKEAYWLGTPCITLRDETEWVETVQAGWNVLAGAETARITAAVRGFVLPQAHPALYGDGRVAERIVECLPHQYFSDDSLDD